jgi:hypothetical protein
MMRMPKNSNNKPDQLNSIKYSQIINSRSGNCLAIKPENPPTMKKLTKFRRREIRPIFRNFREPKLNPNAKPNIGDTMGVIKMANINNGNLSNNKAREINNNEIAPTKKVSTFISNLWLN